MKYWGVLKLIFIMISWDKRVHFNDVLGVITSILIASSGVNLPNYLSSGDLEKCSSTGVYLH